METLSELLDRAGLEEPGKKVLIVEDLTSLRQRAAEVLGQLGHEVTAVLGIESIENGVAVAFGESGTVTLDLRGFDAALLDHYFLSRTHNGRTLTREMRLVNHGRIIGMSSSGSANRAMVEAGADEFVPKSIMMRIFGVR